MNWVFNNILPARIRAAFSRRRRRQLAKLPEILFTPVIFANGRDDDTDGVRAFLEARPVMCRGELIGAGDRSLVGLDLRLSVAAIRIVADGQMLGFLGYPHIAQQRGLRISTVTMAHGFNRSFAGGLITFNCPVQP